MKILSIVWTLYLGFESNKRFSIAPTATYEKIFIFKDFSKRLYKKNICLIIYFF